MEEQDLVYRPAADPATPLPDAPPAVDVRWRAGALVRTVVPDPPLLFRFSAVTFNAHRIHYDLPFAREIERYRGLVVHGPLQAILLADLARAASADEVRVFEFRAVQPAFAGDALHLVCEREGDTLTLTAMNHANEPTMRASAKLSVAGV